MIRNADNKKSRNIQRVEMTKNSLGTQEKALEAELSLLWKNT